MLWPDDQQRPCLGPANPTWRLLRLRAVPCACASGQVTDVKLETLLTSRTTATALLYHHLQHVLTVQYAPFRRLTSTVHPLQPAPLQPQLLHQLLHQLPQIVTAVTAAAAAVTTTTAAAAAAAQLALKSAAVLSVLQTADVVGAPFHRAPSNFYQRRPASQMMTMSLTNLLQLNVDQASV